MDEAITPNEEYGFDIVSVTDDNGVEHIFEELGRIELDDGRVYVALLPVYDNEEEIIDDDGDALILKVLVENGENYLIAIEDEDEFNEIIPIFEEKLADLFEAEDEE